MTKMRLLLLVMVVSLITLGTGLYHRQNIVTAFGFTSTNECEIASGCARCGDGQCQKSCGENSRSCPRDCGGAPTESSAACAKCGDGVCAKSCENARTCPRDCGGSGGTTSASAACGRCGDGVCVKKCGENAKSCPADCGGSPSATTESVAEVTQ